MQALFFVCDRSSAVGVRSEDDLPTDPVGDGLPIAGPAVLAALATALGVESAGAFTPLRDATCQSFPIWTVGQRLLDSLTELDDRRIEPIGRAWLDGCGDARPDADLHEICLLLDALRAALLARDDAAQELFVLIEERAL